MADNDFQCYGWVIRLGDMFWVGGDPTRTTNLLTGAKQFKLKEWAEKRILEMDHKFWREKNATVVRIQIRLEDQIENGSVQERS